ncbi:HD domain-containing protein [Frisingicoccus sp.]|uniref:HD domain-containing protein n=1 Tax=Frisingicoccus sp. TaxID=1918627 RepID=UPI003AB6AD89
MKDYKRIKDPIYGYIQIPVRYMTDIVDTAPFQRLRRIIQTSYSPLYSSAVHNRFVHSMGVYYLGELAADQLTREATVKIDNTINFSMYGEVFKLACLLHDVGHAPFSHTGESFYLGEDHDYTKLHEKLIEVIGSTEFERDIPQDKSLAAAPHEIMSAIIGVLKYRTFFDTVEKKELFVRCITGYKYSVRTTENSIKNCFISMLNSKVIDVDKLDYLIRDAYITGFDTVNIDFERLLSSLTLSKNNGMYEIAYNKNAISVIENVVYAHDAEKKWIQTHPVVLYEAYILQHVFSHLSENMDNEGKKLFSLESLSVEGQQFNDNISIALLCDDDIIFLMKNVYPNEISKEFFERRERRHPVWKSEAEYKAFVLNLARGGELLQEFETAMSVTAKYLIKSTDSWVIDDALIDKLEKEKVVLEGMDIDPETKEVQLGNKIKILKVMHSLQSYAKEKGIECNFVILMASQFNSGFGKSDFSATKVVFQTKDEDKVAKVGDIVSSLQAKEKERDNFFYLFYKRKEDMSIDDIEIDNQEICKRLFKEVVFED